MVVQVDYETVVPLVMRKNTKNSGLVNAIVADGDWNVPCASPGLQHTLPLVPSPCALWFLPSLFQDLYLSWFLAGIWDQYVGF
jgi:hypothetical protein